MDRPTPPIIPANSPANLSSPLSPSSSFRPNPFVTLKSRYLVLGTFVMATLLLFGLFYILGAWQLLPMAGEDPLLSWVSTLAIYTLMSGVILWEGWAQGLKLKFLLGGWRHLSIFYTLLLVASLLLFLLGIRSVLLYLLSLGFPGYVSDLLNQTFPLSGADSLYPRLYNALMIFVLLVYAPLAEELIFRGILLQRWSTKWGLRWGLIASSGLFGLLHFNNPVGLTLFGLVMGLLYIRTRSLWVPIACHALNNLGAVGIDHLQQVMATEQVVTVSDIQAQAWLGFALVLVPLPLLLRFIWRSWPKRGEVIPYLVNVEREEERRGEG